MARLIPRRLLQAPDARPAAVDGRDVTLHVQGLVCALCARRVAASLNQLDGVEAASCDLDSGSAAVRLSGDLDAATLRAAVMRAAVAMPLRRMIARLAGSAGIADRAEG